MKKPVIGIVGTSNYLLTDDSFKDHYRFGNNYIKKILENGAIPYLIPICDDKIIEEVLGNVDGIIFPGGDRVTNYSLDIMDYCYKNKIPVLGICLGMQTMAMYSVNMENKKNIIKKVDGHWPFNITRENSLDVTHKDIVEEESKLFEILKTKEIMVNSLHNNAISEVGSKFKVSIKSLDGEIEGIEYVDDDRFMIGVQFHPEILPQFNNIFAYFIEECKKRK
jgi:putative glutamine amidotransferase